QHEEQPCQRRVPPSRLADRLDQEQGVKRDPLCAPHVIVADGRIDHAVGGKGVDEASDESGSVRNTRCRMWNIRAVLAIGYWILGIGDWGLGIGYCVFRIA